MSTGQQPPRTTVFANIGTVKSSRDANYVAPGKYVIGVDRVKMDKTRAGDEFIAIETTVFGVTERFFKHPKTGDTITELENNAIMPATERGKLLSHNVGDSPSHLIMLKQDMALPNFKQFVMAALGLAETEVTEANCLEVIGADQVCSKLVLNVSARTILTRQNKQFTKITYEGPATRAECARLGIVVPEGFLCQEDIEAALAQVQGDGTAPTAPAN